MNKINKVIACIQILVFLSLILFSSGITVNSSGKSNEFACKEHECGCKSEADCRTNCCCLPHRSHLKSHHGVKKQKNSFQSFISSLKCKSGSDVITLINTELKYILEDYFVIPRMAFSCFLVSDTIAHLCEVMLSPPEKPPRYLT